MKRSFVPRLHKKAGLPPGSLIFTGEQKLEKVTAVEFRYNSARYEETGIDAATLVAEYPEENVYWLNITGLHDVEIIERIGKIFGFHILMLEDILHTDQRPKLEELKNGLFMVLRMATVIPETRVIQWEQVSLILQDNRVLTFQEYPRDVFESVRQRIREHRGQIRDQGADYLAYALIDAIVDHYFVALEVLGERLESLEERVINETDPELSYAIYQLKRDLIFIRKAVWPLREVIGSLERFELKFKPETFPFLRDLYDHTVQVIETVESYRDVLIGLRDTYLNTVSNRMNAIMQMLTIIATIFIPLTFIAGIYGMNFEWMPELKWRWAYPAVWIIMLCLAGLMLYLFKRKRWI
jgi:magnesium transporter